MKLSILLVAACLASCAEKQTARAPTYPVGMTHTTAAEEPQTMPGLSPNLRISSELMRRCAVKFDNVDEAPRFGFDQAVLDPADQAILAQIAKCITDGPLSGRSVRLVGRADPRGETEYNMSLGAHRADGAQRFLLQAGVTPSHVQTTSRGELDATGTDEATWSRDRRVDVELQ